MSKVRRYRHRGLRVVYQHTPGPLTAIALTIRAGARFDGRHPGIAHLTEHMLFQGTDRWDQVALNHRAAELGGEHNADTGYETISLTFEVFNEDVADALDLLAEQFYRSKVSEDRLRKEKRVVFDEIRGRLDDPTDKLYARSWSQFFRGALAHPVCGSISSLRAIKPSDVMHFLRTNFVHARSVLGVVGGVGEAEMKAAVRMHFRAETGGEPSPAPRVSRGGRGPLTMRATGNQSVIVKMIDVAPEPRELIVVGLALDLVGADPDSHLFQEIRERLGLGYDVGASLDSGPDWAVAMISASAGRRAADRLTRAVEDTCERAARDGFTDVEVTRARKKLRYRYASLALSRLDRALALAEGTVSGFPLPEEAERIVARVSRAEIEATWRRVLKQRTLTAMLR